MSRPRQRAQRGRAWSVAALATWIGVLGACTAGDARADAATRLTPAAAGEVGFAADAGDGQPRDAVTTASGAGVYYTRLMLMRAHIHLGEELFRLGAGDAARAHLVAPAEEHLPKLDAALREHGLDRVVGRIEGLADAARASRSWLDVEDLHEAARMSIQRAQVEVDPALREDPGFQAQVLLAVAHRSLEAYGRATADGAIADETAYRASYGYARQGRRILRENEGVLGMHDRDLYEQLVARYERLIEAWPSARVPRAGAMPVAEVRNRLDAVAAVVDRY